MKFHSRLSVGFSVLLFILSILIAINVFEYRLMDKGLFGLCGPLWIFVVLCGPLWIFVDLCGSLWFFVVLCGSLWIFVDLCGWHASSRRINAKIKLHTMFDLYEDDMESESSSGPLILRSRPIHRASHCCSDGTLGPQQARWYALRLACCVDCALRRLPLHSWLVLRCVSRRWTRPR